MYERILVPLDGSELSEAVLPHAQALARKLEARLLLVRATNIPATVMAEADPMGGPMPAELIDEAIQDETEDARDYLTRMAQHLKEAGLDAAWEVVEGEPSRAIIDTAHKNDNDLIAMATHGRSGVPRVVLGSVADRVVRESRLPVLLIRPPVPPPSDEP